MGAAWERYAMCESALMFRTACLPIVDLLLGWECTDVDVLLDWECTDVDVIPDSFVAP